MAAVLAGLFLAATGRPVEAERWADVADRWPHGDALQGGHRLRRGLRGPAPGRSSCRRGHRADALADADEAVRRCAAQGIVTPAPALYQGLARVLSGDLEGGDAIIPGCRQCSGSRPARTRLWPSHCPSDRWSRWHTVEWGCAQALADQASAVLRQAGIEESYATPLVCAAQARAALHRGDVRRGTRSTGPGPAPAAPADLRRCPTSPFRPGSSSPASTLALADLAGARTLMREIDRAAPAADHT